MRREGAGDGRDIEGFVLGRPCRGRHEQFKFPARCNGGTRGGRDMIGRGKGDAAHGAVTE